MNTETRYLADIAIDIYDAMDEQYGAKRPNWWAYAKPYVDALSTLESIDDNYYYDSARSVVGYLIANLSYWRGDTARTIKAELRSILGID
jgi:hypothetical protein